MKKAFLSDGGVGMQLLEQGRMGDVIETSGDIGVQHEFGLKADGVKDGFFGVPGATAWAKSIAVGFKVGFPFWFQCQLDEALMRPIQHDRDP